MSDHRDFLKDLLLEDYRYRAEALRRSEQAGETRVNIFMGLVSVVAASLVALSNAQHGPDPSSLRLIIESATILLTVVGWLTLMRLLIRNDHTDECKRDLDRIRQVFKEQFDRDGRLTDYSPVGALKQSSNVSHRRFGGLAHLMAGLNSLLVGVVMFLGSFPIGPSRKAEIGLSELLRPSIGAITGAIVAFLVQSAYVGRRERSRKREWSLSMPTHAGGIVCKHENGELHYLIISAKNAKRNIWVFPKGHIEKCEGESAAALREVTEETGVLAQVVSPLGEITFLTKGAEQEGHQRAKFYLMRWLFDVPAAITCEHRMLKWLPFEQALEQLTFPESKRLLLLAHAANLQEGLSARVS